MLNKCQFIGNLGNAPDVRSMKNGEKVANLALAVTEKWKSKDGSQQEKTEWVKVVIFGGLVNVVENYLSKGSKIYIEGKMQTRKWQDQSGNDKFSTEIVLQGFDSKLIMLDGLKKQGQSKHYEEKSNGYQPQKDDFEDELPF